MCIRDSLGPVLAELEAGADAVDVVIGGGAHRPPYPREIEALLDQDAQDPNRCAP